jgi:translation elongation factor P/translation initiation factor 5A
VLPSPNGSAIAATAAADSTVVAASVRNANADASALRGPQVQFMDASYDDLWPGRRRAAGHSVAPS